MIGTKKALIRVNTPKGIKTIDYVRTSMESKTFVCNECPYSESCRHLRDPRDPENPNASYLDFCTSIGKENLESDFVEKEIKEEVKEETPEERTKMEEISDILSQYYPEKGAIERGLGKDYPDLIKSIIGSDPLVRVSDVIDCVCKGWCEAYNPERTNCKCSNATCLLRELFLKNNI